MDRIAWKDSEQDSCYTPGHNERHDNVYGDCEPGSGEEIPVEKENRHLDHCNGCAMIDLGGVLHLVDPISTKVTQQ